MTQKGSFLIPNNINQLVQLPLRETKNMTKKDYIKVAKIIKTTSLGYPQRASLAASFASMFQEDNPRFDVQRFLDACGQLLPPSVESIEDDFDERDLAKAL